MQCDRCFGDITNPDEHGWRICPVLPRSAGFGVRGDDIPGGILIRHGICNADGTPKKYYSKTEIRRAADEKGYTIGDDTPKPYKINWSGRTTRPEQ